LFIESCVSITAGVCSYSEGSQYGMLSLHQLMQHVPLLHGSKKQVSKAVEITVTVTAAFIMCPLLLDRWCITESNNGALGFLCPAEQININIHHVPKKKPPNFGQ